MFNILIVEAANEDNIIVKYIIHTRDTFLHNWPKDKSPRFVFKKAYRPSKNDNRFLTVLYMSVLNRLDEDRKMYSSCKICTLSGRMRVLFCRTHLLFVQSCKTGLLHAGHLKGCASCIHIYCLLCSYTA